MKKDVHLTDQQLDRIRELFSIAFRSEAAADQEMASLGLSHII